MANSKGVIRDVIRRGVIYKRESKCSNEIIYDILESLENLEYTNPSMDNENLRNDFKMVRRDVNVSVERCKNEFGLMRV